MPFLALAIPQTRANALTVPIEADGQRHEVVIDMQEIRNQLPERPQFDPVAPMPVSPFSSFRPTFECRPIPVGEYFERALAELVTPRSTCVLSAYASNAELRTALAEILQFHPHGKALAVPSHILAAGLPSLLRDEPEYLPGTLSALSYDVGANSVRIGRMEFLGVDHPGEAEYLFAGESELAFLHEGNRYASRIRQDHAPILAFHYRAAGMPGHTALPPMGYVDATRDQTQLSDFTAQLARCRHRDTSGRATRHSASRQQALSPLDAGQNGLTCSIL
ncbi:MULTISPECIES: hypothetical protein [Pandoraea]|uniref:hypothetical protein n=1 Tax=Pandoraea TaxID=93217 RepID=UPI001F5DCA7F|nr:MULTISPECIES: hypothetical protein [Pandoraea]